MLARAGVEIVPLAVWQGKSTRPWSVGILRDVRRKFPQLKIAHAISPAPIVRGGEDDRGFRLRFSRIVQPGDDILLHVAPWKSVVEKARVEFRQEPTVFGMPVNLDDCTDDCGLDLSIRAFSPTELGSLIHLSQEVLRTRGFGEPKAVFFDEGLVSKSARQAVLEKGISEDWSGVESNQLRSNLARFPVFRWNMDHMADFQLDDLRVSTESSVNLDHLRFAIQVEISDMELATKVINSALAAAQTNGRVVRVPIVFNVEDLIHTHGFVEGIISKTMDLANNSSVPIRDWRARNTSWDADFIRRGQSLTPVLAAQSDNINEAEFVSDEERLLSIEMAH